MWFLLKGLDSVFAVMESVAVLGMNRGSRYAVFLISSFLPFNLANPSIEISLDSSFPDPFGFLSDRSFDFQSERQPLC